MRYPDQYILQLRRKKLEQKLKNGTYELFFQGLLEIPLPEDFIDMPEKLVREKFMMRDVPAYIKTVNNGELTMSLDILDDYATTEEILVRIKKIIKLMCPANVIYEEGNIGDMVGWFESKSNWEKITYYNLYFIIEKEGTKIFGNFQCLFERYDRWKPQIMNILCHLRTGRANYENFSEAMEDNRIITEGYKLVGVYIIDLGN